MNINKSAYRVVSCPSDQEALERMRPYVTVFPWDDNAYFGIQSRSTRAMIVRQINFTAALTLHEQIMEGEEYGR